MLAKYISWRGMKGKCQGTDEAGFGRHRFVDALI